MKNAILAAFYTLGLSAFFPFFVVNHKSSAAWPMFLAPIVAAILAEFLARTVRLSKERNENRVIWLIGSFILLVQVARFTLGLHTSGGFTEYLALNTLYQIVLVLIFAASEKRATKGPDIGHGKLV
jgi:hypothetical protein